ncbi:MAG TPA: 6-phospho-3-hexuloisomerase [Gammaproteobacteria bacterium]|nr:6-phospho-3-hexuloisomerase [Gammaproteobacteria bacterium]
MSYREILDRVDAVLAGAEAGDVRRLIEALDGAPRIFVSGAGRSALAARFFAMRLMHCGYTVFVVGEIVTPSVAAGDLLLVLSGSGATETLLPIARKARAAGARVALLTSKPASPLAELAHELVALGADGSAQPRPGLPMGTVFELSALVFFESVIYELVTAKGLCEEELRARHANLE